MFFGDHKLSNLRGVAYHIEHEYLICRCLPWIKFMMAKL